jgi:hypothetical protein
VFDEHVFPFAQLHSNAGAQLRAEISLLPDSLSGGVNATDQFLVNSSRPGDSSADTRGPPLPIPRAVVKIWMEITLILCSS